MEEPVVNEEVVGQTPAATEYDVSTLRKPESVADLGRDCLAFHHAFGMDVTRRGNMHLIEKDIIVYASSNCVTFQNIVSGHKDYLLGIDEGGVGCVAVHPSRTKFAVGGKGFQPKIYIYSYPEKKILKILSGGAERGYACLNFSNEGDKLASVSMSPDYMLTVWDWESELMGLHSKAFGQDIYKVQFSEDDQRRLTTSGTGHIRFWKMAATFTGLKLQGYIGKFGKIDLSDVENFIELPDGKVISGTETGSLLLWEGNFIKCRFVQTGGAQCHTGGVTYVDLDREEKCVITAGVDGYIRWWDFPAMDAAEVDSDVTLDFELECLCEYFIGPDVGIRMMLDSKKLTAGSPTRFFVLLDTRGQMQTVNFWLVNTKDHETRLTLKETVSSLRHNQMRQLHSQEDTDFVVDDHDKFFAERLTFDKFHAGAITGVDTCPIDHLAVTGGVDGTVRIVNYSTRKEIATRQFNTAITSVKWVPLAIDPSGASVIVGFADGVVRVLTLGEGTTSGAPSLIRTVVFKPHNAPVIELSFDEQARFLATSGRDGIVFFLRCESLTAWNPIRFWTVSIPVTAGGRPPILCERISWNAESNKILCTCTDSVLREVDVYQLEEFVAAAASEEVVTFEASFPVREVLVKIPVLTNQKSSLTALPSMAKIPLEGISDVVDTASSVDATSRPESPTKMSVKTDDAGGNLAVAKVTQGMYTVGRSQGGLLASANVGGQKACFFECEEWEEVPKTELLTGLYSTPNYKDSLKNPAVTAMRYSWSRKFLLAGTADGSVTVRATAYLETFTRTIGNNNSTEGVAYIANSFDDRFVLSVGKDGVLAVSRIRLDLMRNRSVTLFKDLDAKVFGDDVIKPVPKVSPAEPTYLTSTSTLLVMRELNLFDPTLDTVEGGVLTKGGLAAPEQEKTDISGEAYSIQDNRLKLEEDNKKAGAEDLKTKIRGQVKLLQKDYEKIVKENESIPEAARLTAEEMTVDREYFDILREQGKAMIDEVHKECAHDIERAEKLYSKIRGRLMSGLIMEEFTLSAFEQPTGARLVQSVVKSLRSQALDASVVEILKEVHSMVRQAELREAQARTNEASQKKILEAVDEMKQRHSSGKDDDTAAIVSNIKNENKSVPSTAAEAEKEEHLNESSAAARRLKRKARKEEMAAHLAKKPNEDEDDIRDLNAIKLAEKTIGDYKLKCADDYEVPEDQRINALKKIRQMAMLEESMLTMRLQYNERFLALRSVKRAIIYAIRRDNKRIREIDAQLKQSHLSEALWEPEFRAEEFPDDADEVTLSELKHYQNLRKNLSWSKAPPPKQSITTGRKTEIFRNVRTGTYEYLVRKRDVDEETRLYDFLCDESQANVIPNSNEGPKYYEVNDSIVQSYYWRPNHQEGHAIKKLEMDIPILRNIKSAAQKRLQIPETTKTQQVLNHELTTRLNFERSMILKKMQENIKDFREAIDSLRLDRHSITADLKLAELKLLTLYQEYKLLQTFESRDSTLQQKQIKCKTEETEIVTSIGENKARLEGKQEEIQQWNEKLQGIQSEFKAMLPDTHPYVETLTKIFKKKVKRSKGGEDGNEEDEDYESEHDDDEDEDDDEEVEDICPPGCDQALFERILDLREKKLDTEEVSGEIQKSIEDLKKTIDRLKQREKQIIKDAAQTEVEVQQFQLQKQSALNQINVVVPLQVSQLYMFENSGILTGPTDKQAAQPKDATAALLAGIEGLDLDLQIPVNPEAEALKSIHKRTLVSNVDLKSHVVFTKQNLVRIQERISELHNEIDQAKESFRELHKERSVFIKDREAQRLEIEAWSGRCTELQMLKFGRIIDLDELEAKSDRSKELEAENALKEDEAAFKAKAAKYLKECAIMQEKLSEVTVRNTELLNEVAELTEAQLQISRELNAPGQVVSHASKLDNFKEIEETKRIVAYVQFQAKELESLRTELNMLKRKEAPPVLSQSMNLPPPPMRQQQEKEGGGVVLPPIANNKKTPGNTTGVTMT